MGIDKNELYDFVLKKNGVEKQLMVCIEELAELTKELCKIFRGQENILSIAEEVADVEIMVEQTKRLLFIEEKVKEFEEKKIKRLAERMGFDSVRK